jgi:hypothetical protein
MMLLGACYVEPVERPTPARSALQVNVLDAKPTGLVVQADKPLSWVVVEMRPAGQVWVVYADSSQPAGDSGRVIDTLRFERRSSRAGLVVRGGSAPYWVVPCQSEGYATVVNPENGHVDVVDTGCQRVGPGYTVGGPVRPVLDHRYFLAFGSTAPASPAAIDRLLRTVRPVQEPDSLAAAVGASLFRDPAAQWDYAVAYPR